MRSLRRGRQPLRSEVDLQRLQGIDPAIPAPSEILSADNRCLREPVKQGLESELEFKLREWRTGAIVLPLPERDVLGVPGDVELICAGVLSLVTICRRQSEATIAPAGIVTPPTGVSSMA